MASTSNVVNRKKLLSRNSKLNKLKQFPLLNLYILAVAVLEIIGEMLGIFLLKILKPIPMVLMIVYISGKNSQRDHLVPTLIRAGLILSLVGDIFLMVNQISAFMIGTFFFLIAHILYCVAFTLGEKVRFASTMNKLIRFGVGVIYLLMFFGNIYTLWNVMPNKFLFTLYGLVLCLMNIFATNRYQITTPYSFGFTVAGAILFGLSDNLLALLKFNQISSNLGRGVIMLFYYTGQYLLMHGAMHHSNLQHELTKFLKNSGTNNFSIAIGKSNSKYGTRHWDLGQGQQLPIINDKTRVQ